MWRWTSPSPSVPWPKSADRVRRTPRLNYHLRQSGFPGATMSPGTPFNPYRMWVGSFIPNWLMRQKISPGAKLAYARLAQYAGKDGQCYPSQKDLADELGVGERMARQ